MRTSTTSRGGHMDTDADILEILDRVRRIETVLFKLCIALGVNPRTGEKLSDEQKD